MRWVWVPCMEIDQKALGCVWWDPGAGMRTKKLQVAWKNVKDEVYKV